MKSEEGEKSVEVKSKKRGRPKKESKVVKEATAETPELNVVEEVKNDEEATGAFVTHSTKALYVEDTCDWQGPVITYAPFIAVSDLTLTFDYMLATDKIYSATGFALGGGGTNTENLKVYFKVFPNTDGEGRYTGTSTLKYFNASSWSV